MQLAWRFTEVLPETFERDREKVRGIRFPIVTPLPLTGQPTKPIDPRHIDGPFIYALFAETGAIKYVGVATEEYILSPLDRWIRPNKEKTRHYWAHGTNKKNGGVVVKMAEGLVSGEGPYSLYFTNYGRVVPRLQNRAASLGVPFGGFASVASGKLLEELEHALIYSLQPPWNERKRRSPPKSGILRIADYWNAP
ncbi:MAG: hypothetical protein ACXWUF_06580 [Methylomagnum sp.]